MGKAMRGPAAYAICVGALMCAMWTFFILTGQVPEFSSRPAEIGLHLTAEFGTSLLLLLSGVLTLVRSKYGPSLLVTAFGMLLYTIVVSPGYYIERGQTIYVAMFALLFLLTIVFLIPAIRAMSSPRDNI